MIKTKDKYLIISLNDNFYTNCHLLNILSDFENKCDSEIYIILKESYDLEYTNKLINILGYISELHHVNHFIKIFTSDKDLINSFDMKKDLLHINGIEIHELSDAIKENIIEIDTRSITNGKGYVYVYVINKDCYSVYDTAVCFPEIKVKLK